MTALDELVEDMASVFAAPCTLEDPEFRLLGFSDQRRDERMDEIRQRSILERRSTVEVRAWFQSHGIREAVGPVRTPGDPARGISARLCIPARHLGRVWGYFWVLQGDDRADESRWPEAMAIAEAAATLLNLTERRQADRDALYRDTVEGQAASARRSAVELAAAAGIDVDQPVRCVLVDRPDLAQQLGSRPVRSGVVWARESGTMSAAVVGAGVLGSTSDLPDVLATLGLARRIADLDRVTRVGVGPTVGALDDLARSRSGARVALRVAHHRGDGLVSWTDLGPLRLLGLARSSDLAHAVLTPELERFLRNGDPTLVDTVTVFLEEAGAVGRTADRLAVHRQTVYHRLAQVERATGSDLRKGDDRLRLHLALSLMPFLEGSSR